uniref:uncharacterized protein LOC120336883 n=1 Tax=Styela clava TaxID=7725 RepID=UPI00193A26E0|nr:uncharacterized protein LOC120336883 [Styela clava]
MNIFTGQNVLNSSVNYREFQSQSHEFFGQRVSAPMKSGDPRSVKYRCQSTGVNNENIPFTTPKNQQCKLNGKFSTKERSRQHPYALNNAICENRHLTSKRTIASQREKKRVQIVTKQLHVLRDHLPYDWLPRQQGEKISKISVLRCAISYISYLTKVVKDQNEGADLNGKESSDDIMSENNEDIDVDFQEILEYIDNFYTDTSINQSINSEICNYSIPSSSISNFR